MEFSLSLSITHVVASNPTTPTKTFDDSKSSQTVICVPHRSRTSFWSKDFDYRVIREDGRLVATGTTEHCFLSREGRASRAPERIRRILGKEIGG